MRTLVDPLRLVEFGVLFEEIESIPFHVRNVHEDLRIASSVLEIALSHSATQLTTELIIECFHCFGGWMNWWLVGEEYVGEWLHGG